MKGITIPEQGHVVNALPPVDIDGGAQTDWFNLKMYDHVDIIIIMGVTGAASTVTVEKASDAAGSDNEAIAFDYYAETTDAGDTLAARASATASGFATSANDNIMYVISIDAAQIQDLPYLSVLFSDPALATFASVVAVMSGARYGQDGTPTAIT